MNSDLNGESIPDLNYRVVLRLGEMAFAPLTLNVKGENTKRSIAAPDSLYSMCTYVLKHDVSLRIRAAHDEVRYKQQRNRKVIIHERIAESSTSSWHLEIF
jgi:hypothetical protein